MFAGQVPDMRAITRHATTLMSPAVADIHAIWRSAEARYIPDHTFFPLAILFPATMIAAQARQPAPFDKSSAAATAYGCFATMLMPPRLADVSRSGDTRAHDVAAHNHAPRHVDATRDITRVCSVIVCCFTLLVDAEASRYRNITSTRAHFESDERADVVTL